MNKWTLGALIFGFIWGAACIYPIARLRGENQFKELLRDIRGDADALLITKSNNAQ